jgi:hypothetical protein
MGIVIKLTESQLKEVIKNVIKEDNIPSEGDIVPCSSIGVKTIGFCNKTTKTQVKFGPCSFIGIKHSGFCEFKTKQPIVQCSKLGVKSIGMCYVSSKQPVPTSLLK